MVKENTNSKATNNTRIIKYWDEDLIQIIEDLNEIIWDEAHPCRDVFSLYVDGNTFAIRYGGVILWDSDDEDRKFDDVEYQHEPLFPFIKKKFNEYVNELIELNCKLILHDRNTVPNIPDQLKQYPPTPESMFPLDS